jgi:hypothetical protein
LGILKTVLLQSSLKEHASNRENCPSWEDPLQHFHSSSKLITKPTKVLINALTAEVDLGAGNFTGFPTNQDLSGDL